MTTSLRSMVSYHVYIALIAVFAFWIYYQTLDIDAASTLATTSLETNGNATAEWMTEKQSWLQSELSPLAGLGENVKTGVVGTR